MDVVGVMQLTMRRVVVGGGRITRQE